MDDLIPHQVLGKLPHPIPVFYVSPRYLFDIRDFFFTVVDRAEYTRIWLRMLANSQDPADFAWYNHSRQKQSAHVRYVKEFGEYSGKTHCSRIFWTLIHTLPLRKVGIGFFFSFLRSSCRAPIR